MWQKLYTKLNKYAKSFGQMLTIRKNQGATKLTRANKCRKILMARFSLHRINIMNAKNNDD